MTKRYEMNDNDGHGAVRGTLQILGNDGPQYDEISAYMIVEHQMGDGTWKRSEKTVTMDKRSIQPDFTINFSGFTWK